MKNGYVYILANESNSTVYVGVTSDLVKRVYEHKNKLVEGFTSKYNIGKLVYFEVSDSVETAIEREKQVKKWRREKKDALVNKNNPDWRDLYTEII